MASELIKKRPHWMIPVVVAVVGVAVFSLLLAAYGLGIFAKPRQVGEDNLMGMTTAQVIARYGPPDVRDVTPGVIPREEMWIYYKGRLGGGTGIVFRDDVVQRWEMRAMPDKWPASLGKNFLDRRSRHWLLSAMAMWEVLCPAAGIDMTQV